MIYNPIRIICLLLLISISLEVENYPNKVNYLWLTVPDHPNWLYKVGEIASVEVSFFLFGIPQDIEVTYEIGPDMMPSTSNGKAMLEGGKAIIEMGTMDVPGFLDLRLKVNIDNKVYEHHCKVGFSPEELKPYTKNPEDFDDFWIKAIEEARKTKLTYTSKFIEEYSKDGFDTYLLKIRTDSKHYIYAYLTKPQDSDPNKKYPVVFHPPGAGVKQIYRNTYYAKNGFIRLEIDIHGLSPEITAEQFQEIAQAFSYENDYYENGLDDKDNYYMKHVYIACIRSIDLLTSLPEWDGKNVFVQGGSQGGALSIVTAGLDKRVTACVVNHPAYSDMAGYLANRAGGFPHFNRVNNMFTKEKVETMAYYDVTNFARRIECIVYMSWGFNDNVCPPTTSYIVWNLITSEKESLITPINEHWTSETTDYDQMLWLKEHIQ